MIVWWCLLRYKPKAESMREIIDRPNFVRIKNFCSAKKQCQGNEKVSYLQMTYLKSTVIQNIQRTLQNSTIRKQFKKWVKEHNRYLTKAVRWQINICKDRCSPLYVIREMQLKK